MTHIKKLIALTLLTAIIVGVLITGLHYVDTTSMFTRRSNHYLTLAHDVEDYQQACYYADGALSRAIKSENIILAKEVKLRKDTLCYEVEGNHK